MPQTATAAALDERPGFDYSYRPNGKVLAEFMQASKRVRLLLGHVNSGSSSCCINELFRRALEQAPGPDGRRRSRTAVVRNTYSQLRTTTMKTWEDWFDPTVFGHPGKEAPYRHLITLPEIGLWWEVFFIALDKPEQLRNLLSMELTSAWLNEGREIDKDIVDAVDQRLDRFPSFKDGGIGPTWTGMVVDSNPMPVRHWWPVMAGDAAPPPWMSDAEKKRMVRPPNWQFFKQPPAMISTRNADGDIVGWSVNPNRENAKWVRDKHFEEMIQGKADSWIEVYCGNQYGDLRPGKLVYENFNEAIHVRPAAELELSPDLEIHVWIDPGLTGGCLIAQRTALDVWYVLHEFHAKERAAQTFARYVMRWLKREAGVVLDEVGGVRQGVVAVIDPAGDARSPLKDADTALRIWREAGFYAIRSAPTNDPTVRIETVDHVFGSLSHGEPRIVISDACTVLLEGLRASYKLFRHDDGTIDELPDKDRIGPQITAVQDSLQYGLTANGETRGVTRSTEPRRVARVSREYQKRDVRDRKSRRRSRKKAW